MSITRRQFNSHLGKAAAAVALAGLAAPALGSKKAKVVVIGGGAGGATAAKYIAKDAAEMIDVTLIESSNAYTTCFHSNLVLGGVKTLVQITHSYDKLASKYGIKFVHQQAKSIDKAGRKVTLADGSTIDYDALVISPGIDLKYDSVPGWGRDHEEAMPHAWKAGPQTTLLKAKLDAIPDGGLIVMLAPPNPFRCPPGPYERVSMMAHTLKRAGKNKCRIIILDPKEKFSKQALFQEAWDKHYTGMIDWFSKDIYESIESVDPATNTVVTGFETYKNAALVNVIPAQMAGAIARESGLANDSGYCPIDPETMLSVMDPNIYVVGDACIPGDMPKSAYAANSQAKVAALAVRARFAGAKSFPARYKNTCWSMLNDDESIKVGGRYVAKDGKIAAIEDFVSKTGEDKSLRKLTHTENMGWYEGITADLFS